MDSTLNCRPPSVADFRDFRQLLLATGLFLATISGSAAQFCPPGAPLQKSCGCPWGTHIAGSSGLKSTFVGCGYPCPMCTQDDPPQPERRREAPPNIAGERLPESETADENRQAVRKFRTQRGVSYVERRDISFSSESPDACATSCMKDAKCGRATFWLKANRCFKFTWGARTEDWGFNDNKAISFSFE
jgi:hypothetical protein